VVRIIDEPEPVFRRELFQVANVETDSRPILKVSRREDDMQVIEAATLPLCDTGERFDGDASPAETTFDAPIQIAPTESCRAVVVPVSR
jgi:hypothetical protein